MVQRLFESRTRPPDGAIGGTASTGRGAAGLGGKMRGRGVAFGSLLAMAARCGRNDPVPSSLAGALR